MKSRTANSAKNMAVGILGQFLSAILNFVTRTVFIYYLSEEYLGLNGLFANVISILAISELGVGSAISFALYKPLAEKDEDKICALMGLYAKAYRVIGITIFAMGVTLLPIVPLLAKGSTNLVNLRVLYFLYLIESVSTYVFFAYKSALLKADQRNYIVFFAEYIVSIIKAIVRILILVLLQDRPQTAFYLYTLTGIGFNLVSNYVVAKICDNYYPFIKRKISYQLPEGDVTAIKKNVVGAFANKISAASNEIAGNLIISSFIGVITMGIYSNYLYFVNTINTFIRIFANSTGASIGNFNVVETTEKKLSFLKVLHFIYTWIYGFCAICLWVMLNPFIQVWAGSNYLLSTKVVMLIVINFFVYGLLSSISIIQQEAGIFWESKFISLLSAGVCVACSLIFTVLFKWDISGVLLASIISRFCVELPFRATVTCRSLFDERAWLYIKMYLKSCLLTFLFAAVYGFFSMTLPVTWAWVMIRLMVTCISVNLIWYLMFRKKDEFRYLIKVVTFLFHSIKSRRIFGK